MPKLFLLAGPPGAGKTTIADRLARGAPRPAVHVPTDQFYVWSKSGFVVPYMPEAAAQNEVVTRVMVDAAVAYARGGYDAIVEGILGPWLLPAFEAAAAANALPLAYVVLRPSLDVALARATAREGRALRDIGPIAGLHGAFMRLGAYEPCAIDTGAMSIDETVDAVRARFAR